MEKLEKEMRFTVPTGWDMLTQEQLRRMLRLLGLYGDAPEWQDRVRLAALLHFCDIEASSRTDRGWLCRERGSGKTFLLDAGLLPDMLHHLDWMAETDSISVRIERVGEYEATDFKLRRLMFGDYLMADNYYQAFLTGKENGALVALAKTLYGVPDGVQPEGFEGEVLTGAFFWFGAAKRLLAQWFPHFLKPATEQCTPVCQESQHDATQAQIRLLTKGDVTKQKYILEQTDTWTALAELDALAREAEELKRKSTIHNS